MKQVPRLRELRAQPGVCKWWGPLEAGFPFDEPESQRFAIVADGRIVGMVQWGDSSWGDENRHAYVDIFLGDDYSGRGIGTEVMRRLTEMLIEEQRYHRIVLDAAIENAQAIRSYEKAGFRAIGTHHRSYLEPYSKEWRDELYMELVVEPRS